MKKLILLFILISFQGVAQDYTVKNIIDTLVKVESDGNQFAIGDNGKAVGCLQIWEIMVKECNRILGRNEFTLKDRYSVKRSKYMATVFLSRQISRYKSKYGKYPDELTLASSWNTGSIFNSINRKYVVRYKLKKRI